MKWPKTAAAWLRRKKDEASPETSLGAERREVLSGREAVLAIESQICSSLCCGMPPSFVPSGDGSARQTWHPSPREAVASACGLAMSGRRVAALVPGDRLSRLREVLVDAAVRRVPMVVHAFCPALSGLGISHDGYESLLDSGVMFAMARNPQDVVDLTLMGRAIAEKVLTPVLIGQDALETGLAPQDLLLPDPDMIHAFLGEAGELIASPTAGQKLVFGEQRHRMPAWVDLDRPAAFGGILDGTQAAAGQAAQAALFDSTTSSLMGNVTEAYRLITGRSSVPVTRYRLEDADVVLVAQGASIPVAEAAVEHLRATTGWKGGVLGILWRRPFPRDAVREALQGKARILVLSRTTTRAEREAPLLRDIRTTLHSEATHVHAMIYGVGGQPVTTGQLIAACQEIPENDGFSSPLHLGVARPLGGSKLPKRDMLLTSLVRDVPDTVNTVVPEQPSPDTRPENARTICVRSIGTPVGEDKLRDVLSATGGAHVRSRCRAAGQGTWVTRLTTATEAFSDPGDETPTNVLVMEGADFPFKRVAEVVTGGWIVFSTVLDGESLWAALPADWREEIRRKKLNVARISRTRRELIDAVVFWLRGRDPGWEELPCAQWTEPVHIAPDLPATVRRRGATGYGFENVPRFWCEVVEPRFAGEPNAIVAEPSLGVGAIPACTSTFKDRSLLRTVTPRISQADCTACGLCWTVCPDAAIGAVGISAQSWFDVEADPDLAPVKRYHRQLGAWVEQQLAKATTPVLTAELVDDAFAWLLTNVEVSEEDQPAFSTMQERARKRAAALPLVAADNLFHTAQATQKGSGKLLALAISPRACQGCGLCATECPADAITMHVQTQEDLRHVREAWSCLEVLPDTPGETIRRCMQEKLMPDTCAVFLSRHCRQALPGGDSAQPGSGQRLALRQIFGVAEYALQQTTHGRLDALTKIEVRLREGIRDQLASSLHVDDLGLLEEAASRDIGQHADVSSLLDRLETLGHHSTLDGSRLSHLAELAQQVKERCFLLAEGPTGLGRARYQVVVCSETVRKWALRFPYNPFSVPVVVDDRVDGMALGLARAAQADHLNEVLLRRQAELLLEAPPDLPRREETLAAMTYEALPEEDRATCAPVVVVVERDTPGFESLVPAMAEAGLPLKVIVLDGYEDWEAYVPSVLAATLHRSVYVASTSMAHPDHLYATVCGALASSAPALLHIYAPCPIGHGFASDQTVQRARVAVETRTHPLLRFDPGREGVFGTCLDLDDNPAPGDPWTTGADGEPRTPVHWAQGEERFQGEGTEAALELAVRNREAMWQLLQELAGLATPFIQTVKDEAAAELNAEHARAIQQLNQEHEQKLDDLRAEQHQLQADQLRDRLLTLAHAARRRSGDDA